jgi:hypothetical protein
MEAANSSETSVSFYVTTQCNIPEDSNFRTAAVRTRNLLFSYYERDLLLNDTSNFCSEYLWCLTLVKFFCIYFRYVLLYSSNYNYVVFH